MKRLEEERPRERENKAKGGKPRFKGEKDANQNFQRSLFFETYGVVYSSESLIFYSSIVFTFGIFAFIISEETGGSQSTGWEVLLTSSHGFQYRSS